MRTGLLAFAIAGAAWAACSVGAEPMRPAPGPAALQDDGLLARPTNRAPAQSGLRGSADFDWEEDFESFPFGTTGLVYAPNFEGYISMNSAMSALITDPAAPAPITVDLVIGDVSGDGVVNMTDVGLVVGAFGRIGGPSDLNGDGRVDTADIGLVLTNFGKAVSVPGPGVFGWCEHVITGGAPLGGVLLPGDRVYLPDDGICLPNRRVALRDADTGATLATGDWSLSAFGVPEAEDGGFFGLPHPLEGDNQALVMIPAGAGLQQAAIAEAFALLAPTPDEPVVAEADFYLAARSRTVWFDCRSSCERFTALRVFMGGTVESFGEENARFFDENGEMDRFVFLASAPGLIGSGVFLGSAPDPGYSGKRVLLNEWFRVQLRLYEERIEIWVRDSETLALARGVPGMEEGFARIFPAGPFGPAVGPTLGEIALDPQPLLAANSVTGMRFFADAFVTDPWAVDNLRLSGPTLPPADVQPLPGSLALNETYSDDLEGFNPGLLTRQSCGTWFETAQSRATVVTSPAASGARAVEQVNATGDFIYRTMFRSLTPFFEEQDGQDVVYRARLRLSDCATMRALTILDRGLFQNVSLLTGWYEKSGAIAVDGEGLSEFYVYDWFKGVAISTGVRVPGLHRWFDVQIRIRGFADPFVTKPTMIEVSVDGQVIFDGEWTNSYGGVIGFDSDNNVFGAGSILWVDDVSVALEPTQ